MYIRFVISERHPGSDQSRGIFSAIYDLERRGLLAAYQLEWFHTIEVWFDKHLRKPDRFAWSSRPNAPERAITWLRIDAAQHVSRMRALAVFVEHMGVPVEELRPERPGYIAYEDEFQVAAIPFTSETYGP